MIATLVPDECAIHFVDSWSECSEDKEWFLLNVPRIIDLNWWEESDLPTIVEN